MSHVPFSLVFRRSALKVLACAVLGGIVEQAWNLAIAHDYLGPENLEYGDDIRWSLIGVGVAILTSESLIWLISTRTKDSMPLVVRQIISLAVWFIILFLLGALIFKVPVSSVFTTSGIFVGVVGLALNRVLSDMISGVFLPNRIGDWIEVDGQPVGEVVEVNWRQTTLLTDDYVTLIVPNNMLAVKSYRVYTQPEDIYRERTPVLLPLWVKRDQAERVLMAAVYDVPEMANLRPPVLTIHGLRNGGVEWALRTFTPHARLTRLRGELRSRMANNLHIAGIPVLRESAVLNNVEEAEGRRPLAACLAYFPLFDLFNEEERCRLADLVDTRIYPAGSVIIAAGEPGASLLIMREGLAQAFLPVEDGPDLLVGNIVAGNVFGEMSVLTGAPRRATVKARTGCLVHELSSANLAPFLKARPELVERLARVVTQRQMANDALRATGPAPANLPRQDHASLLAKVRLFFGL